MCISPLGADSIDRVRGKEISWLVKIRGTLVISFNLGGTTYAATPESSRAQDYILEREQPVWVGSGCFNRAAKHHGKDIRRTG
jgi:hypothetical protein